MSRIENTNPNLKKVGTILQAAVARQSLFLPPRTGKHCFFKVGLVSIVLFQSKIYFKVGSVSIVLLASLDALIGLAF